MSAVGARCRLAECLAVCDCSECPQCLTLPPLPPPCSIAPCTDLAYMARLGMWGMNDVDAMVKLLSKRVFV